MKGKYGTDPRGVQFVSFEMPDQDEAEVEFEFTIPDSDENAVAKITNTPGILGIIVLFDPNK